MFAQRQVQVLQIVLPRDVIFSQIQYKIRNPCIFYRTPEGMNSPRPPPIFPSVFFSRCDTHYKISEARSSSSKIRCVFCCFSTLYRLRSSQEIGREYTKRISDLSYSWYGRYITVHPTAPRYAYLVLITTRAIVNVDSETSLSPVDTNDQKLRRDVLDDQTNRPPRTTLPC